EITGYKSDEAQGLHWSAPMHPEDIVAARFAYAESVRNGTPFAIDSRYVSKSGKVSWVHGSAVPLRDAYGAVTGYMASMVDVTERMLTLAALAKSEANFRSLVERAPFGVVVTHLGVVTYANDTYLSMLGFEH